MSFFPDHAEVSLDYAKAMRERNRLLKDGVQDAGWYSALEVQMAETGAQILAAREAALSRLERGTRGRRPCFPSAELTIENAGPTDAAER